MATTRLPVEEQVQEAVRLLESRHGFQEGSIRIDTRYDLDCYEIKLSTYLNSQQYNTIIRLTNHMLTASASGYLPMLVEYLIEGIKRLRAAILAQCSSYPKVLTPVPPQYEKIFTQDNVAFYHCKPTFPKCNKITGFKITCGSNTLAESSRP
jgi:hypothetical protein